MIAEVADELPPYFSKSFGSFLGLIEGDGSVANKTLDFANSNPDLIKFYLDSFKRIFGNESQHYYLALPQNYIGKNMKIKKVLEVWKRKAKISNVKFHFNKKGKSTFGVMKVVNGNKLILQQTRRFLNPAFLLRMINDRNFVSGYISGFLAAEGTILPEKNNPKIPHSIQLPSTDKKILNVIEKYLKNLNIDCRIVAKDRSSDYYCVIITRYDNFQKFFKLGLANLHKEKENKLRTGLKSYKIIPTNQQKTGLKILKALLKQPLSRHELYQITSRKEQTVNGYLYSKQSYLLKKGFIQKVNIDDKILWELTTTGKKFLQAPTFRGMKINLSDV
jgi:hypothetical protein